MGRKLHPLLEYSILFVRPENSAQVSKKADTENGLQLCSRSERCVKLLLCSCATICVNLGATAGAWNFGLCATRSREPRQARKGATVPGTPRVPQITRGSSHRRSFQSSVVSHQIL